MQFSKLNALLNELEAQKVGTVHENLISFSLSAMQVIMYPILSNVTQECEHSWGFDLKINK